MNAVASLYVDSKDGAKLTFLAGINRKDMIVSTIRKGRVVPALLDKSNVVLLQRFLNDAFGPAPAEKGEE